MSHSRKQSAAHEGDSRGSWTSSAAKAGRPENRAAPRPRPSAARRLVVAVRGVAAAAAESVGAESGACVSDAEQEDSAATASAIVVEITASLTRLFAFAVTPGEQLSFLAARRRGGHHATRHPLRPPHSHGSRPHARPALRAATTPCCPAAAATLSYGQHQPSRSDGAPRYESTTNGSGRNVLL